MIKCKKEGGHKPPSFPLESFWHLFKITSIFSFPDRYTHPSWSAPLRDGDH